VAINTKDDSSVFRMAFSVRRVMNDVVDTSNSAVAFASCENCQTTAVALQVVLVFSDPAIVTPENVALAINVECSTCETVASAYQYVLTTGGPVHYSAEGNQILADLRQQLLDLKTADLTPEELLAAVDAIAQQFFDVTNTELLAGGPLPTEPTTAETTATETGSSTATTSPEPTTAPTSSPEPGTTESSPAPEETSAEATPAPSP
jgi:putative peptide zinc metalloprotease protein